MNDEPDDRQAWESEYEQWCKEQEEVEQLDTLNRILRAMAASEEKK